MNCIIPALVRLVLPGLVGGVEGVLQGHKVLAGFERIEDSLLGFELFGGVIGGFDRETDATISLVNLDDPRRDILADLEDVLDLIHALLTHLGDMDQAIDVVLQATNAPKLASLVTLPVTRSPTL